jgi:hypothetical protein
MHRRLLAILCPLASLVVACYDYRPATSPAVLVGRRIQLLLTDSGSVVLAARIGPAVEAIEGQYLGDSAGVLLLAMAASRARSGVEMDWRGERVAVPRALVASMLERRFSRSRTAFASGLAVLGIGAMTAALRGKGDASGGGSVINPPPPPK